MEYENIKQLMKDMSNSKLTSLNIDFPDGTKVSMKKENNENIRLIDSIETGKIIGDFKDNEELMEKDLDKNVKDELSTKYNIVKSPMVGTFYIKPSPNEKPYVEVGAEVKKGETLCIIEAMKLMNEIESDFSGRIKEILLKDGDPVEYGTELFIISND